MSKLLRKIKRTNAWHSKTPRGLRLPLPQSGHCFTQAMRGIKASEAISYGLQRLDDMIRMEEFNHEGETKE